jgi:hypothetical protein
MKGVEERERPAEGVVEEAEVEGETDLTVEVEVAADLVS